MKKKTLGETGGKNFCIEGGGNLGTKVITLKTLIRRKTRRFATAPTTKKKKIFFYCVYYNNKKKSTIKDKKIKNAFGK